MTALAAAGALWLGIAHADDEGWLSGLAAQRQEHARSPEAEQDLRFLRERPAATPADAVEFEPPPVEDLFGPARTYDEVYGTATEAAVRDIAAAAEARKITPRLKVFVSLGMPEKALRPLLAQGAGSPEIVYYVRGWTPPDLAGVFRRIHELTGDMDPPPVVMLDPHPFREHGIEAVPAFAGKDPQGAVRVVHGEISIEGAINAIEEGRGGQTVGQLHAIEEPDILEVIEERVGAFDWEQALADARERAVRKTVRVDLPTARKDSTYLVDLSIETRRDVLGARGETLANAGTRVNPLHGYRMQKRYIVFDPSSAAQLEVVRGWQATHRNTVLLATNLALTGEEPVALSRKLGQPVYPANPLIVERFGISEVPAIAEQAGEFLKITTVGIEPLQEF